MKQTKRLFLLLQALPVLLLLAMPTQSMAQGQDENHKWNGNSISSVADNLNEDLGTVYLYNVGTGKFLNAGSYWGTVVIGFNIGMTVHIQNSTLSGHYTMTGPLVTSEGKYIAFGRKMDTPGIDNIINFNRVYVDRGVDWKDQWSNTTHKNGILDWKIEETSSGSKTYYIHCYNDEARAGMKGEIYLTMAKKGTGKTYNIKYPHEPSGAYSQWKIITKKDLKEAFKGTYASDEAPADATFLIYDQQFERGNIYVEKWVASDGLTWKFEDPATYQFKPNSENYTYYVGNGAVTSNYYMAEYAGYTTANVRNVGNDAHANGKVTQAVTTLKKGWYKVSCNGFYNAVQGSNMVSSIFAKVQGTTADISNVSTPLNRFNHEFTYTKEDMLHLYNGDNLPKALNPQASNPQLSPYAHAGMEFEKGKYNNMILVYVPTDRAVLNIGIEITGSTEDLDWTSWDNFQLQYCGDNDMVLDEGQTSLEYLEKQGISPNNAYTLILKRTMKPGLWSSITLPVALTAGQFKTAFGDYAKLAHLKGQDENIPTRIDFESVNLTEDDNVVIYPEQLYIMQSTRAANVATGNYEKLLKDNTKLIVSAPYFTINNVVLPKIPDETFKETPKSTTTEAGNIQFCGTQINQTSAIVPAQSYVLGANNGKWYYTKTALPIKGFRCWIATNANGTSPAKPLTFAVDGKVEGDVTAIQGLEQDTRMLRTDGAVYNLHGQKVASDASNLNSLPAGIYIVNNKKILVK